MLISRRGPALHLTGAAIAVLILGIGCGRGSSPEHREAAPTAEAEHTAEGAEADHHDDEGVVELSAEAMKRADIRIEPIGALSSAQVLVAPAELQADGDRVARVGPRVVGRIAQVMVPLGANVRAGQPLATIRSPEAAEATATLDSARAAETLARRSLSRERELFERRVSAQREVLEAEAALANAEAAVRAAEARLAAKGFSDTSGSVEPVVTVTSPIAGTVIERAAAADAPVAPDSVLFTIADLSSLWLTVRVPETSVDAIRKGQTVGVLVGGRPDRPVNGRVDYIAPIVAPDTRTVDVRVQVPNGSGELRPGTSASATFDLPDRPTSDGEARVLVPRTAVHELNQSTVVFVPDGENRFKRQPVALGSSFGNQVEVLSGVKAGDRIVVQGAFTLKAQALRGAVADPH